MKIRNGYVSNSSSSSFCLNMNLVDNEQKELIVKFLNDYERNTDGWYIAFRDRNRNIDGTSSTQEQLEILKSLEKVCFITIMDNDNCLENYLSDIGVPSAAIFDRESD